jgi:hypothetical protein
MPSQRERKWNTGANRIPSKADDVGFTLHILEKLAGA